MVAKRPSRAGERQRSRVGADRIYAFCRGLPGVTEDVKWGDDLVFSVGGKMFAGFRLPAGEPIGFKVDPAIFGALIRRRGIVPAPYAARFHWVSVAKRSTLPAGTLEEFLAASHALVAAKLPRRLRAKLGLS
jgi:predicted DNA-binding protein (MmcQ/YjbR family)